MPYIRLLVLELIVFRLYDFSMFKKHTSAQLLFAEAEKRGLKPVWETPDGLFSFLYNDERCFVYYTKLHLNSQLGAWMCNDKSLTRVFLEREGFPTIPFCYSNKKSELNSFFDKYHPVIQKPLLGMKSHGVHLISNREELDCTALEETMLERYIEGTEFRCLVLQGKVIGMQQKVLEPTPEYPWRKHITNLDAKAWNQECVSIASAISNRLHMGLLAVDFIQDAKGKLWVLELNAMPGLHSFHNPDVGVPVDIASMIVEVMLLPS